MWRCTGAPSWCSQHFNPVLTFTVMLPPETGRLTLYADGGCKWRGVFLPCLFFCPALVIKCHTCWAGFSLGGEAHRDINNAPVKVCVCVCELTRAFPSAQPDCSPYHNAGVTVVGPSKGHIALNCKEGFFPFLSALRRFRLSPQTQWRDLSCSARLRSMGKEEEKKFTYKDNIFVLY